MTPTADDPLDPHVSAAALHEARSRLHRAARVARRAWLTALGIAVALAAAASGLFAVSLFVSPGYVLMWTLLLAAAVYNVTRFWPHRPGALGVVLAEDEVRRLRQALDPHAPHWPLGVTLVPDPVVTVTGRHLTLGVPLLACLAVEDLRRLVALAVRRSSSLEEDGVIRRALGLVDGDLGRGSTLLRRAGRSPRWLIRWIQQALAEFAEARRLWLVAFRDNAEASSVPDTVALHHQDLVAEAWLLLRDEWLDPAVVRGCWHPAPFSSLREFMAGVQSVGALDGALPARPTHGPLVDLVAAHEEEVADVLLGDRCADDLRAISWSEHPSTVTVPRWRELVGEALDVSRQLTGQVTAPTVDGVLGLIESGDLVSVARQVAPDHGLDPELSDWASLSRWVGGYRGLLLTAIVGMAAVDSGRFRPRWSWPDGTSLVNVDGWVLPLHQLADEVLRSHDRGDASAIVELGTELAGLGIDVAGPLWLTRERGDTTTAERPTGSFVAFQGLSSRQVIVTDRAVHVFGRPWSAGLRNHYAMRMRGADELRTRMLRVWQGDETDQTAHLVAADILRARFSVLTGGGRWRLVLHGRDGKVTLRGFGDGRPEEEQVAGLLGDRLTTTWLHSPRELFAARNAVGWAGLALGAVGLVAALLLPVFDRPSWPDSTAPLLALGGVLALALAVLPDLVMEVVWRVRGPAERPEPLVVTRHYARRPPPAMTAAASQPPDPFGPTGSAVESMTLDLGDHPDLPHWPDELVDLDDLPDLPDLPEWPPEMAPQR